MASIFVTIPSYADPDVHRTIDSAIRSSSGQHAIHISVLEQVTRYTEAYALGRLLAAHVQLDVGLVDQDRLLGVGGARHLAEQCYANEDIQVQVDSHARFDADWDVDVVRLVDRMGDEGVCSSGWSDPWTFADRCPSADWTAWRTASRQARSTWWRRCRSQLVRRRAG